MLLSKLFNTIFLLFLFISLFIHCTFVNHSKPQNYYYADTIRLIGKLDTLSFYGPPGYGMDPLHDSREITYILILKNSINVYPKDSINKASDLEPNENNIDSIQLAYDYYKFNNFIHKFIEVKGNLFHQINAHHHTKILMMCDSVTSHES